ncbi:hypothetical protein E4U54_004043 [Claviceps lovelessii]|nr:hypothetical protein E4U54_004043 [Claviceps lovelessii]
MLLSIIILNNNNNNNNKADCQRGSIAQAVKDYVLATRGVWVLCGLRACGRVSSKEDKAMDVVGIRAVKTRTDVAMTCNKRGSSEETMVQV